MKKRVNRKFFLEILIILLISMGVTLPFFMNNGVISGMGHDDWAFHFGRIRSLVGALEKGSLPVSVNYLDFASQGIGVNAAYPFFSLYLFIWPFLLPIRLKVAVFIFVFLLNIVITVNIWGFVNEFTNKIWIKTSIAILYVFNNYHLILMYKRFSLGELLGYMMVPLVALGILQIWEKKKSGIILLAWGVSLIINSHLLSLLFIVITLVLVELVRILGRKINLTEIKYIGLAAIMSLPMTCVTIYNFLTLSMNNNYVTPAITLPLNNSSILPGIYLLDFKRIFNPIPLTQLNAQTWNLSTLLLLLSIISIIYLIIRRDKNDSYYILSGIAGVIILILSLNIINWDFTENINIFSFIRVIQFPGRVLMISVIFLIIPIIRMLIMIKLPSTKVLSCIVISALLLNGIVTIHRTAKTFNDYLPENIMATGINNQVFTTDYYPEAKLNKKKMTAAVRVSHSYIDGPITFGWSTPTFKSAHYNMKVNSSNLNQYVTTPAIAYKGFQYDVQLNGSRVAWKKDPNYGTIAIKSDDIKSDALNTLDITIEPLKFEMILTIINLVMYIGTAVMFLLFSCKRRLKKII
ncbi:hypothetical protein [Latilactobacillus fuchuensis]|uniref:hypothetical protein n=1 Tax=Latilactobacillus fuchuensis TaxID=164393 RepID=UPI0039B09D28